MTSVLDDLVQSRVAADPVTTALAGSVRDAVAEALAAHLPRLAFTTAETAQMLGATGDAVCRLVVDG